MRQSGTYRGWRGRAAGGQVEIGQMQEKYFLGASLCVFGGCVVLTIHLHQSLPERLELRISLPISQDSQLTNALRYCKGWSPVTVAKNWIWSIARQYLLEERCRDSTWKDRKPLESRCQGWMIIYIRWLLRLSLLLMLFPLQPDRKGYRGKARQKRLLGWVAGALVSREKELQQLTLVSFLACNFICCFGEGAQKVQAFLQLYSYSLLI